MRGIREFPVSTVLWALVKMSRPTQLLLVAVVFAFGVSMGVARGFAPSGLDLLAGLVSLLLVAASIHYANEYADYETDRLTTRTPFSGGSGALPRTGLPRRLALGAAVVTFVLGTSIAVGCLLHGFALPALGALTLGAGFGWQYSVGPLALAWRGWGELDNAALGGLALPAFGYAVVAGTVEPFVLLASVPFFLLVFLNLLDTTWPDRAADAAVGKDTLATRWSVRRLRAVYLAVAGGWLASLFLLGGPVLPPVVVAGGLLAAPFVAWGALRYTRTRSPLPSVAAMVVALVGQLLAWTWLALG